MRSPTPWNIAVQHDVGDQVLADVNVAHHGAQERHDVDSAGLHTSELGLRVDFWAAEMIVVDGDDVAIW